MSANPHLSKRYRHNADLRCKDSIYLEIIQIFSNRRQKLLTNTPDSAINGQSMAIN